MLVKIVHLVMDYPLKENVNHVKFRIVKDVILILHTVLYVFSHLYKVLKEVVVCAHLDKQRMKKEDASLVKLVIVQSVHLQIQIFVNFVNLPFSFIIVFMNVFGPIQM